MKLYLGSCCSRKLLRRVLPKELLSNLTVHFFHTTSPTSFTSTLSTSTPCTPRSSCVLSTWNFTQLHRHHALNLHPQLHVHHIHHLRHRQSTSRSKNFIYIAHIICIVFFTQEFFAQDLRASARQLARGPHEGQGSHIYS